MFGVTVALPKVHVAASCCALLSIGKPSIRTLIEVLYVTSSHTCTCRVYVCIYIYIYTHTYIYIYIYIHTHTHMHARNQPHQQGKSTDLHVPTKCVYIRNTFDAYLELATATGFVVRDVASYMYLSHV